MGSHAAALRRQGADLDLVDAIGTGDLTKVKLVPKDRALLKFVKLLTETPSHTTDETELAKVVPSEPATPNMTTAICCIRFNGDRT